MVSKTSLTTCIRAMDATAFIAGIADRPDLIAHRDDRGRNWLHLCASVDVSGRQKLSGTSIVIAKALLDGGVDVNAPAFCEGSWHATPLWYAVSRGRNYELASFLLNTGSSADHCLWAAAFNEDLAMLDLLVKHGAPLEAVAEGETPLLGAVKYSKFKAARFLLDAGADSNFRDATGRTALHYMLRKGSAYKHFEMFAEYGALGDIEDADGKTAIDALRRKRDKRFHAISDRLRTN